jgi:hypothetical protein
MNPVNPELSLWIGEEPPPGATIGTHFDVLVLAAIEIQDATKYPGIGKIMKVPLDDNGTPPTASEIYRATFAGFDVAKHLRNRRMVLSTCHLGKNRSSLVAGLALRNLGWSSTRVIESIRRARGSEALGNQWFEEIIRVY